MTTYTHKAARPHLGGTVRRTVLPSGLRVVTEDMAHSQTLSLGFFIQVGSRHESTGLCGAAHFLEHVLFKGTATRSAHELSAAFDRVGGESNAYTAKDHTCFFAKVLADDADMAVDVMSDMLTHSLICAPDVESERGVILDEISMHNDDPLELAYSLVAKGLYGDHALGRDVIGTVASITAMTREQVHSFWKRHYQPSDIVVSAAGAIDHDWLVGKLSLLPGTPVTRRIQKAPLAPLKPLVVTRSRDSEQCSCLLAFRAPAYESQERYAADLLATVLGGGMSSRLFDEVREQRGLAYHIDASTTAYMDAGQFTVEWLCAPERVGEIAKIVENIITQVAVQGITSEELARAKGQLRGQTLLAFESPDTRMNRLGKAELMHDSRTMNMILDAYEATTAEQIRDQARLLFAQHPVMAVVGAKIDKRPLDRRVAGWRDAITVAIAKAEKSDK
ncbi:MAG: M16 family metallopeptidase [Propionibacteriaceae bacterium]